MGRNDFLGAIQGGLKRLPMSLSAKNRSIPLSHVTNLCVSCVKKLDFTSIFSFFKADIGKSFTLHVCFVNLLTHRRRMLKLSLHCVLLARLSLCATCRDDAIAYSLSFDEGMLIRFLF